MIGLGDLVYYVSYDEPPIVEEQAIVGLVIDCRNRRNFYSMEPAVFEYKVLIGERTYWYHEDNLRMLNP